MEDRIEIRLTEINDKPVSLQSMTADALESFMVVMSSLKSIAESVVGKEELRFSIQEGSALYTVEAPPIFLDSISGEMEIAINGESRNKEVTGSLRKIQEQIKREDFDYKFSYKKSDLSVDFHGRLILAKKISLKRLRKDPFKYELKILRGVVNQIGGNNPNYHFDYGGGERITIDCSKEEAKVVNIYLYTNVHSLVLCKIWDKSEKKDEYFHRTILDDKFTEDFRTYLQSYYEESDLVKQLGFTHDFVDTMFETSDFGHEALRTLLIAFNDSKHHLSELKTLLVISKPFKEHPKIKNLRLRLLDTYQRKRK